ncbi:MAG: 50S ribosomal protein L2 [Patescibacteria group bacterium]|nr:50S ribosomal protein L2 [Patescibacteria group bacterium]
MAIKVYKPITPGRRQSSVVVNSAVSKNKPERSLISIIKKKSGRNNSGKITVRHRGGGTRCYYRQVDFKRNKFNMPAVVETIEYDPNRTAYIALLKYEDNEKRYILAPAGLKGGDKVLSSKEKIEPQLANAMPLKFMPIGAEVHNVELEPGRGGKIVRSAGMVAILMGCENRHAQLKLPSSEIRLVPEMCLATLGQISKSEHRHIKLGKAGRTRYLGKRPTVRGKAMNPCDHPHGGGEGGCSIGLVHPKTPWGKPALGVKTRKKKKNTNKFILKRRKSKKKN